MIAGDSRQWRRGLRGRAGVRAFAYETPQPQDLGTLLKLWFDTNKNKVIAIASLEARYGTRTSNSMVLNAEKNLVSEFIDNHTISNNTWQTYQLNILFYQMGKIWWGILYSKVTQAFLDDWNSKNWDKLQVPFTWYHYSFNGQLCLAARILLKLLQSASSELFKN